MCNRSVRLYSDEVFGCGNIKCSEHGKNVYPVCIKCEETLKVFMDEKCIDTMIFKDAAKAHVKSEDIQLKIKNKVVDVKVYYTENKEDLNNITKNLVGLVMTPVGVMVSLLDLGHSIINLYEGT